MLTRRGGVWWFQRRVPAEFADLDTRGVVKQSTRIKIRDDKIGARATAVAAEMNRDLEAFWAALRAGAGPDAKARYEAARKQAKMLGFVYAPVADVAALPLQDILNRVQTFDAVRQNRQQAGTVLLGGVEKPKIALSGLFEEFKEVVKADIIDLSEDQFRRWKHQKTRAIANLKAVIGDKPIDEITRPDAIEFKAWWQQRVISEGLKPDSANKEFGVLSAMLRTVDEHHRIGLGAVLSGLRLESSDDEERVPFETDFIRKRLLDPKALAGLNPEARDIIYMMIETGMRPAEIVNLTAETIFLGKPIPYVMVRPDGRRMKTPQSRRDIPLVGVSLIAAARNPNGFPRYRDKSATLSATINKFFDEKGLRPTPQHTLYSLRHSFEDRLTAIEIPEKIQAALMGHKYHRPRYGKGPSLEQKRVWLNKIALKVPRGLV